MPFNLIREAWLPVRRASGQRLWIKPADITADLSGDPVVALDFPRPDWNAATIEFLIGLFTCALAPEDEKNWRRYWLEPPSPDALAERLERIAFAFNLDGDGPRAFQDIDLPASAPEKGVSKLLIDAPGANAIVKNTDHFNKRDTVERLSVPYAAAALITLQTYAPYDSPKFVASIRSVGAVTTLISPSFSNSLWHWIWANSPKLARDSVPLLLPVDHLAWTQIFPWLRSTRTYGKGVKFGPDDGHQPLMAFFAIPRRIRLCFLPANGQKCSLDGPDVFEVVAGFRSETYGPDYVGWCHPLSPHFDASTGSLAAVRTDDSPSNYRDWLGLWGRGEKQYPAAVLSAWPSRAVTLGQPRSSFIALDAFGFTFKQAQPKAWVESRVPFYAIDDAQRRDDFYCTVRNLVGGSETAAGSLRYQIKIALFGVQDREGNYKLLETSKADEAGSEQAERFWRETEAEFRETLDRLAILEDPSDEGHEIRQRWLRDIRRAALRIFDDDIAPEDAWNDDPRRLVYARHNLAAAFNENNKVWKALGLPPPLKPKKQPRKGAGFGARP